MDLSRVWLIPTNAESAILTVWPGNCSLTNGSRGDIDHLTVGAPPPCVGGKHVDGVLGQTSKPLLNYVLHRVAVDNVAGRHPTPSLPHDLEEK